METYLQKMKDEWAQLIGDTDPQVRLLAAEIAGEHAKVLSQEFYSVVLSDSQAADFLTNDQVERQLKTALQQWIIDVLSCPVEGVEQQIQVQQRVADVHARIGIPVDLVEMGF
jgi:hypothetical protein